MCIRDRGYLDLSDFGAEYANSGNAGGDDIIAALRWVRDNIAAVSYTHLDVYKRQALNDSESSRRGVNTWLNEQATREIYLEVADKAITDGGAWSVMTGFNPVSYTHLDVYKRQA